MRQIEQSMIEAILDQRDMITKNTKVGIAYYNGDLYMEVYLYGTKIAEVTSNRLFIRHSNWKTNTTKSRLNALLTLIPQDWRVRQSKYKWFLETQKRTIEWSDEDWRVFSLETGELYNP